VGEGLPRSLTTKCPKDQRMPPISIYQRGNTFRVNTISFTGISHIFQESFHHVGQKGECIGVQQCQLQYIP
jgi:hypothetical protein